jgi:hypothetical protein
MLLKKMTLSPPNSPIWASCLQKRVKGESQVKTTFLYGFLSKKTKIHVLQIWQLNLQPNHWTLVVVSVHLLTSPGPRYYERKNFYFHPYFYCNHGARVLLSSWHVLIGISSKLDESDSCGAEIYTFNIPRSPSPVFMIHSRSTTLGEKKAMEEQLS